MNLRRPCGSEKTSVGANAETRPTSAFVTRPPGNVQRTPAGNTICPSESDVLNGTPAVAGASQSFASRVQRYTHAAAGLSGSLPAAEKLGQPHDQTPSTFV